MNRTIALFLLVSIYLHAEVSINESVDKFHPDLKIVDSSAIIIKSRGFFDETFITMSPSYVYAIKSDDASYTLYFKYKSPEWAFFDSAIFLIDGNPITIKTNDISRDVDYGAISEFFSVNVSDDVFLKISSSKTLSLRLSGSKQTFDFDLEKGIIVDLNTFYQTSKAYRNKTKHIDTSIVKSTDELPMAGLTVTNMDTIPIEDIKRHNLNSGVLIIDVASGSIAEKAGFKRGDIIKNFGFFQTVKTKDEVKVIINEIQHGDYLLATVFHQDDGIFPTVLTLKF